MKTERWLKVVLSVFLLYHLCAVLLLPMGSGLMIRELGRFFIPYANTLGLNTTWQFFSPGPSPIFYLEYSYVYAEDEDESDGGYHRHESEVMFLPERRVGFGISDFYSRRLYSMRFLALNPERIQQYLAPWLCRQDRRAQTVTLRQRFEHVENVEKYRGGFGANRYSEMSREMTLPFVTYDCLQNEDS